MKLNERGRERERERGSSFWSVLIKCLLKHKINATYKNGEDQIKLQYGVLFDNKPREIWVYVTSLKC